MKKTTSILIFGAIITVGIVVNIIFSNQSGPRLQPPVTSNKQEYKTVVVNNETTHNVIEATGRLEALNKIDIYAEVGGVLQNSSVKFKAGNRFSKDDVLVSINDEVYKNNLLAQKSTLLNQITLLIPDMTFDFPQTASKWEEYLSDFDFNTSLNPLPETTNIKERNYLAAKNIYNLYYTIKSMEATLEKYNIRAPFDGIVTKSNINPGTLVRNGQLLGEFLSTDEYELVLEVSPVDASILKKGQSVILESQDNYKTYQGTVNRINGAIDAGTQLVKVFVRTRSSELRDGMYFTAKLVCDDLENVARIPRSSLTETNEVYVKQNSSITPLEVNVVKKEGNNVYVKGLENNTEILAEQSDFSSNTGQNNSATMN